MENITIEITPLDQVPTDNGLKMRRVRRITMTLGLEYEDLASECITTAIRDFSKQFRSPSASFNTISEEARDNS